MSRVHLLCGLPGAGKTTHARRLAEVLPAVRFSLDEWMLRLYALRYDEPSYAEKAEACKELIWSLAQQVLALDHDVVLDWNLWSRERRAEWRNRAASAGYPVLVHYIKVPVATAIERAERRTAQGVLHSHALDEAGVRHLQTIFEEPNPNEGIEIVEVSR